MTLKAEDGGRPEQVRIVLRPMDVVASKAFHAARVHQAGNKIVALHPVSTPGTVRKILGIRSGRVTIVELPEFAKVHAGLKAHSPGIISAFNRVQRGFTDRVALNANIVASDVVESRWINNICPRRLSGVHASGAVTSFASHIPFGDGFRADIEVDGVTTIALLTRRYLSVRVGTPRPVANVPRRRKREIVVAGLAEVSLFELATIYDCDITHSESPDRVRLAEIGNHHFRPQFRVGNDVGHPRLFPSLPYRGVTRFADGRAHVACFGRSLRL